MNRNSSIYSLIVTWISNNWLIIIAIVFFFQSFRLFPHPTFMDFRQNQNTNNQYHKWSQNKVLLQSKTTFSGGRFKSVYHEKTLMGKTIFFKIVAFPLLQEENCANFRTVYWVWMVSIPPTQVKNQGIFIIMLSSTRPFLPLVSWRKKNL